MQRCPRLARLNGTLRRRAAPSARDPQRLRQLRPIPAPGGAARGSRASSRAQLTYWHTYCGAGTFGRVLECWDRELQEFVAIKVIRNVKKYYQAAMIEVRGPVGTMRRATGARAAICALRDLCSVAEKQAPLGGAHPSADAARCGAAVQIEVLQELKKGDPERRWRVRFARAVGCGTRRGAS